MKYSFMSFSCPELSLGEMLSLAGRLGYDGIEPRIDSGHKHGVEVNTNPADRKAIKEQAGVSGVELCCIATSCRYADPETLREQIDQTRRCIDLAADVGSSRVRVFGGQLGQGLSRADAIDQVCRALQSAADHAHRRGVTVCMETHDDWCDPAHVAEVMKRVDRSAIAVNWDIMHPFRKIGATMEQAYETLKPWVRHVHFHDGVNLNDEANRTLMPVGQGDVDHHSAVSLLKADGYDGFLSGEWIRWADHHEVHLPRELATMRGYEGRA